VIQGTKKQQHNVTNAAGAMISAEVQELPG
jgi:hypothetical protein